MASPDNPAPICLPASVAPPLDGSQVSAPRSLDEPDPARDARVAWHRVARFGCLVHWGVYSAQGGEWSGVAPCPESEHLMRWARIPRAEYLERVIRPFNPEKFDAQAWIRQVHDCGMRYFIITAKHHDGVAMYPSKVSACHVGLTQFKRDPIAELRAACETFGIKFGLYYSHAVDWEHPDGPGNDWELNNPGSTLYPGGKKWWLHGRADFLPRAKRYVDEKSLPQIRELISWYHPDILWFDTPGKLPPEENARILTAVRALAPRLVVNGRLLAKFGDYTNAPNQQLKVRGVQGHWEGVPTTNGSYGWLPTDRNRLSPEHCIALLAETVAKGGNLLLNVGPMGNGEIDPKDALILRRVGEWMRKHSESIYGADRTPLGVQPWGTSTRKGNVLYLHVFRWPSDGRLLVAGLKSDPVAATVLGGLAGEADRPVIVRVGTDDVEIHFNQSQPDSIASVLRLDFAEAPIADPAHYVSSTVASRLHVMDGRLVGWGIELDDGKLHRDTTRKWRGRNSGVEWFTRIASEIRCRVRITYATAGSGGGEVRVYAGDRSFTAVVQPTADEISFATVELGAFSLAAGHQKFGLRATGPARDLMRLRAVELIPDAQAGVV